MRSVAHLIADGNSAKAGRLCPGKSEGALFRRSPVRTRSMPELQAVREPFSSSGLSVDALPGGLLAKNDVDAFGAESAKVTVEVLMAAADPTIKDFSHRLPLFGALTPATFSDQLYWL